jgi:hypothetical protein
VVAALAQGHHPFAFAVAELVDNSLRATRANTMRDRNIRISLVLHPDNDEGLVSVSMRRPLQSPISDDAGHVDHLMHTQTYNVEPG